MDILSKRDSLDSLVLENQNLVHYVLQHNLKISVLNKDYEDLASIGMIGLIKASKKFDSSRNIKFATYCAIAIKNEILLHFKKSNKYANDVSLYELIYVNLNGDNLYIEDTIIDKYNSNFENKIICKDTLKKSFEIIFNTLKNSHKVIFLYSLANFKQPIITQILGVSQSYVSRICKSSSSRIKHFFSKEINFCKIFSSNVTDKYYEMYFDPKDVSNYANALLYLEKFDKVNGFNVTKTIDKVSIKILPIQEDIFIFAEFFKALYY